MGILFALAFIATVVLIVFFGQRIVKFVEGRGLAVPNWVKMLPMLLMLFGLTVPAFAQDSAPDINIDLTPFWTGFNQFVNQLSPIFLFIFGIPAAVAFLWMIGHLLESIFSRVRG